MNVKIFEHKITLWAAFLCSLILSGAFTLWPAPARAGVQSSSHLPLTFTRQLTAPHQPVMNPITGYEGGDFSITWSETPTRLADTFVLQQASDAAFTTNLTVVCTTGVQSCHLTSVPAGAYYYRVKGHNPWGDSAWSTVQSVTTLLPETPAIQPIDNPNGLGSYSVSWNTTARATSYLLQEDTSAGFPNPQSIYNGPLTSFSLTGKTGATYYYRLAAAGYTGQSSWSSTASTQVIPPQAPGLNFIDNPLAYGTYSISWSSASWATGYNLQESTNSVFSTTVTAYSGTETSWVVSNKPAGAYYYRVRSEGATGPSAWSATRFTTVLPPDAPLLEVIQNVTQAKDYTITWKPGFRTNSFILQESTTPDFASPIVRYQGTDTTYQVENQITGTYYYRIQAIGDTGVSAWSTVRSAYVLPW